MSSSPAKYYKLPTGDGLEALWLKNYNQSFPFHFHPTYNISLVYEGCFNTQLTDRLVVAQKGTILITNPHEIHANPFKKDDSVSFFTFYINQEFLSHCNNGEPVIFNNKVIDDQELFSSFHRLAMQINAEGNISIFEENLKKVLRQLSFTYGNQHLEDPNFKLKSVFDDFLGEEGLAKFSLMEAAKSFGIDKYKFLRLFKAQTGLTPNNYFILKRIEKSKSMLAAGHDLLTVAIDLGFYDTAHYCNHFKKFTGISPLAYAYRS